ncbi:MAG: hypothetical protein P0Y65_05060 [Candidatus Devosia phytovorans]|uniref:SGNH/GDSL hydrolase family protein n=1 Tax=Candidatus Devosia phytovorans TaxID=3121372 RepID=A0AAJ5VY69_9HYPH|nr:hypothetical protein [Devosia sp.]WEK05627.1 MAG: hypothetical protein P0Y65_05060 [Devosia sp.]
MFQAIRTIALAVILFGLILFVPPLNTMLYQGVQTIRDVFDQRPERRILFIGNSRTFYNNMPQTVLRMVEGAGGPDKLHVEMYAKSGVSLETHWADPQVQALLAERWDDVIIQAQSTGQYSAEHSGQLWQTATKFIDAARAAGAEPAMFVTWRYTALCPPGQGMPQAAKSLDPAGYANMHRNIQIQHARLAEETGVALVNVGQFWEGLQGETGVFHLYDDCNHPSAYGSYLSALMFYNYFTGGTVGDVGYRPDAVPPDQAWYIRGLVSNYLGESAGS